MAHEKDQRAAGDVEANADTIGVMPHRAPTEDPMDPNKLEFETRHLGSLERTLKSRHVQFLALSGAIGTGLFVGSGQALSLAGENA